MMTHAELVLRGARWLKSAGGFGPRCKVVFAEMVCTAILETPDVIGWDSGGRSHAIECKTTRSDFRRDREKTAHRLGRQMGHLRYYLTPPDVLQPADIPQGVGLLFASGSGVRLIIQPVASDLSPAAARCEAAFLVAALRRHEVRVEWIAKQYRFRPYSSIKPPKGAA